MTAPTGNSRLVTVREPDIGRCDLCGSEGGARDLVRTPSGSVMPERRPCPMCNDGWRTAQDESTYPCTHCEPPFEERLKGELMTKFLHDTYSVAHRPEVELPRSPLRALIEAHLDLAGWRLEGDTWVKEPYRLTFEDAVKRQIAEECDDPSGVSDPWPSAHGYDVAFDHPKVAAILKRHLVEAEALGQIHKAVTVALPEWCTPQRRLDAIGLILDDVFDDAPILTLPE